MQQGGGPNQATTVGVVMGLINKLLPTDENVKADSESRVVYAFNNASSALLTEADLDATAEGAQVSFTANLAQLELYLKMKLINFGLPDYAGRLFSRHGNAGVMYFVNTVDPLVNDAMSSSPSTLTPGRRELTPVITETVISPSTVRSVDFAPPPTVVRSSPSVSPTSTVLDHETQVAVDAANHAFGIYDDIIARLKSRTKSLTLDEMNEANNTAQNVYSIALATLKTPEAGNTTLIDAVNDTAVSSHAVTVVLSYYQGKAANESIGPDSTADDKAIAVTQAEQMAANANEAATKSRAAAAARSTPAKRVTDAITTTDGFVKQAVMQASLAKANAAARPTPRGPHDVAATTAERRATILQSVAARRPPSPQSLMQTAQDAQVALDAGPINPAGDLSGLSPDIHGS